MHADGQDVAADWDSFERLSKILGETPPDGDDEPDGV